VSLAVVITVVALRTNMKRFKNPRELLAYLVLMSAEHSSGGKVCMGYYIRTGNAHVKQVLIEKI
jgi:transposase